MVLERRPRPGFRGLEVEPLAVAIGASDWPLLREVWIRVEDPVGAESDQDLYGEVFELYCSRTGS
jgi:hypothetical protein